MINFRYHVVSLTGVFLALAIGLVLGTAALNGPLADNLYDDVQSLRKDNSQLRDQIDHLEEQEGKRDQFIRELAPTVLANKLAGRRVAVLATPTSSSTQVDGVVNMLGLAGAKVTARLTLQDGFTDPEKNEEKQDLVDLSGQAAAGFNLPPTEDGVQAASALLAAVLLDRTPAPPATALTEILSAFEQRKFVTIQGEVTGPAEAAIMVTGLPHTDAKRDERNRATVTVIRQFNDANAGAGQIMVAGVNAGPPISEVLKDPTLTKEVSTVDNVSSDQGQLATVLALAEQLAGRVGHYGVGDGATALVPKPAAR